jgi:hypothetical protein
MPTKKQKVPWMKPNPKGEGPHKKLSSGEKGSAKARAKKAGRPYPNLIDNMAASREKSSKKHR